MIKDQFGANFWKNLMNFGSRRNQDSNLSGFLEDGLRSLPPNVSWGESVLDNHPLVELRLSLFFWAPKS